MYRDGNISKKIQLLDCTLRDGSYINGSDFGSGAIKGIIGKLSAAKVDIVECGWLKDAEYTPGSAYYHVPSDMREYLDEKNGSVTYVAMIDYNRYDVSRLPECDGSTIDAIRVVFPKDHMKDGMALAEPIRKKGYRLFYQAANTLGYSDRELLDLIEEINRVRPESISIVDTFGAMYPEDLERITSIFLNNLDEGIKIGFHSHNNMQLSFALSIQFIKKMSENGRECIVDSSLCGMGRGAGNTTTELLASFLNRKYYCNYDLDTIMDAIDVFMVPIQEKYKWGYSTPTFIAGLYCCHVNNIDYLLENHRTNARDMRGVIEALTPEDRLRYDYDNLEQKYIENQNHLIDDETVIEELKKAFFDKEILLLAPGNSLLSEADNIKEYAGKNDVIKIAVNALIDGYDYDYIFITSPVRYDYARDSHPDQFNDTKKILLSNIKTAPENGELIVRFERAVKPGYDQFDNAVICAFRLLDRLGVGKVSIAGFDSMADSYSGSYADKSLPVIHGEQDWKKVNEDIKKVYHDFRKATAGSMQVRFLTASGFIDDVDIAYGHSI